MLVSISSNLEVGELQSNKVEIWLEELFDKPDGIHSRIFD
jgi:hypothetical protein